MKTYMDIPFLKTDVRTLCLDLYLPENVSEPPLILWIHGGGWNELNRDWNLMYPMTDQGYAVASVGYRYADEAAFPAQILDLKAALRFLKKNGALYGYDGSRIIASGDSAGAHLACLLGTSAGYAPWEEPGEDCSLQAVVDLCGPIDLGCMIPEGAKPGDRPGMERLLGAPCGTPEFAKKLKEACPVTYIDGSEPPFLIVHGTDDPTVPPAQSFLLRNALEQAGDRVQMYYVPGAVHSMGGELLIRVVREFLDFYIKGEKTVTAPPVLEQHFRRAKLG